jgi:hypothetical protein
VRDEFIQGDLTLRPISVGPVVTKENGMKTGIALATAASLMVPIAAAPAPALAQHHTYHGRNTYHHYHHRYRCKRSSGTTGLIAGGAGGALIGHALGGGTLGTIAGGVGGALLGKHLDQKHDAAQNRRNGC